MTRSFLVVVLAMVPAVVWADDDEPQPPPPTPTPTPTVDAKETIMLQGAEAVSYRSVAEDFLVLPEGADVGGRLRSIVADGGVGTGKLKLTDLALFDADAQWAIARHYELDVTLTVMPKQPSMTSEPVFQGASLALRRDLVERTAMAVTGAVGPLLGMKGYAVGGAAFVTHKHRLNEIVSFSLAGGVNTTFVRPSGGTDDPMLVEGEFQAAILARAPEVWGGWMGVGYAVPALWRGRDPVSGMALAPQPRLDLNIGNAVQLDDHWDLAVELTIFDRGDLANPATRLPIIDGGFDQMQLMVGISRRLRAKHDRERDERGSRYPLIQL